MLKIIFCIVCICLFIFSVTFRFIILNLFTITKTAFVDIYYYFKHKKYNNCKWFGKLYMFTAQDNQAFGCGKSLSMVHLCNKIYQRYHNKPVWDYEQNKFVNQRIFFISNLELKNIPTYIPFTDKLQFEYIDLYKFAKTDIVIFVLDECGVVFNNREYKTNLPTSFITRLLQVRHFKIGFITNAQRFQMVDKVFREVTNTVTTCKKFWRFVWLIDYDAYELENAVNPSLLQGFNKRVWFALDKDFDAYDTNYNVSQLRNDLEAGKFMTSEEILASRGFNTSDLDQVVKLKKRFRLRKNK